jgi:hypothetical protein
MVASLSVSEEAVTMDGATVHLPPYGIAVLQPGA